MKLFLSLGKEKKEIPIVYQLGWWPYQHLLEVHHFDLVVVKSTLNLLNSKSLIAYTVKGILKEGNSGIPFIKSVHHSEQLLRTYDTFSSGVEKNATDACIQITPIVEIENKTKKDNGTVSFEFTNRYWIQSLHWGDNRWQFRCADIHKEVCLKQRK